MQTQDLSTAAGNRIAPVSCAQISADRLREAFSCFPSGVTALCSLVDGVPVGMAVSSFATVSLSPPLLSVCIQKTSSTWQRLQRCRSIGVSVLSEWQDKNCRQISSKNADERFAGVRWNHSAAGAIFIDGAAATFDCGIVHEVPAGDHSLVLLEIRAMTSDRSVRPLVFHASRFTGLAAMP